MTDISGFHPNNNPEMGGSFDRQLQQAMIDQGSARDNRGVGGAIKDTVEDILALLGIGFPPGHIPYNQIQATFGHGPVLTAASNIGRAQVAQFKRAHPDATDAQLSAVGKQFMQDLAATPRRRRIAGQP